MSVKDIVEEKLQVKQVHHLDKAFFLKIFTPEQCTKIIKTALDSWIEKESMLQQTVSGNTEENFVNDLDYRNTTLFSPPKPDEWLFSTIIGNIKKFNDSEEGHQFDIAGMVESPNMMKYTSADLNPYGKPGKYDWHMDIGSGSSPSMRKLSYSILLNPGEYEGGELAFNIGRELKPHPSQSTSDFVGVAIVFPSYLVHRIQEVTKGIRYALVGWIHGNSFR
jgi:PKHD-type hydroxylase